MRYVYLVRNMINCKVYVGQTKNFSQRKAAHLYSARKGIERPLYRAIRKYGEENFTFEILEECNESNVCLREQHWVSYYDSFNPETGYNLTSGGEKGFSCSENTKTKMSKSRVGKMHSERTKKLMSQVHKIRCQTQEFRERMRKLHTGNSYCKGKTLSLEHKRKISEANKGKNTAKRAGSFVDCLTCNERFWVKSSILKQGKGKYCSKQCYRSNKSS